MAGLPPPRSRVLVKAFDMFDNANDMKRFPRHTFVSTGQVRARHAIASDLALDHLQLQLGNSLGGIEALRTGLRAIHDGVATIKPERILQIIESLAGAFIAAVLDPARRLQQCRRAEITFAVPPVARARGRA